ncbi:MAG: exodeoxyribonuclease VII small subunit [Pseudomonadota bacterium]|jgi:exodeoxyribonuclease VII small subunit
MAKGKGDSGNSGVAITLEDVMSGQVSAEQIGCLSFESALGLLEGVVAAVESGNLPLDQAIGSYERGTQLVQHLRSLLSGAEEKLRVLGEG